MKMTGSPRHRDLWRSHGGSQHGPCVETYTIPEAQFDAFCRSVEAPLLATIETQDAEIERLREALTTIRKRDVRHGGTGRVGDCAVQSDGQLGTIAAALKE